MSRVYKLKPTENNDGPTRLVDANSQSQAYRHAAITQWTATVATQGDLIELIGLGCKVEKAKGDDDAK